MSYEHADLLDEALRPFFAMKDRAEAAEARIRALETENAELREQAETAEAQLAAAREALELYREAVEVDATMEGPRVKGVNRSALHRAWDADRAALATGHQTTGSEAET